MGKTVYISEKRKKILESIRDYYGYSSIDAAIQKLMDEADVDKQKMTKAENAGDVGLGKLIEQEKEDSEDAENFLSGLEEQDEQNNTEEQQDDGDSKQKQDEENDIEEQNEEDASDNTDDSDDSTITRESEIKQLDDWSEYG